MTWTHDALAADLAGHLLGDNRMVWTDMQLGPSGSPRPDVFTLQRSYSRPMPTAFEVKVSRSDLRSDTTSGKWQKYLAFAGSVTFAVPDGLATVADIPDGCGLIVRKAEVWRYAKKPTVQHVALPMDAVMKLLIDGVSRRFQGVQPVNRHPETWRLNEVVRKKFGDAVAETARDLTNAQQRIASLAAHETYARQRVDQEVAQHRAELMRKADAELATWKAIRDEICAWLDIEPRTSVWAVRQLIEKKVAECKADARVAAAEERIEQVRSSLERALATLPARSIPVPESSAA